jgi:hypothetical protein
VNELDRALADISAIRTQIARGSQFRGFGPATLAATGALALFAGAIQAWLLPTPSFSLPAWIALWSCVAVIAASLAGYEAVTRSRRLHSPLADEMIQSAAEGFMPAAVAGIMLTLVLSRFAPETRWMLPGLWQIIVALGLFASLPSLPRPVFLVCLWYLAAGLFCLAFANGAMAFSPLAMALPFGIGQSLLAIILLRHGQTG